MIGYKLKRTFVLGVRSLALHKLRSTLTALGIIFGVSSVISMLSIGEGASFEAQEEIKKLGSENIILKSKKPADDAGSGYDMKEFTTYGLNWQDYRRLDATFPTIRNLVPVRIVPVEGRYRRSTLDLEVVGTTADYYGVANLSLTRGRFLTQNDLDTVRPVAVLGATVAETLFPVVDPIGEDVKLGSHFFKVVGILRQTGSASGTGGTEADDKNKDVYVPMTTAETKYGQLTVRMSTGTRTMERVELHQIIAEVESDDLVSVTARGVRNVLARFHDTEDFDVLVPLELLQQKERTKFIFNIVLGSIAAISLLVGGIGVMNIMLANITERTREIGVRRALGAKKRDIVTQFLVETVVLTTAGGVFGIVLGVIVPFVVEAASGMPTIITFWSIALSFGISAVVGIVFGLYPARRAADLDPIEALRHE